MIPGKMVIIAFDPVPIIKEWLCLPFMEQLNDKELQDPYWPYTHILGHLVSLQGTSVWSVRNLIRSTELSPSRDHRSMKDKPKHNYIRLHDISRHAIHVLETLDLSVKLSESILREHKQLAPYPSVDQAFVIEKSRSSKEAYHNTRSRLAFFNNALFSLRCRSSSNHQRLNNEIQLRFHMDSQFDSQTSIEINNSAKTDSASMRWIAIVSLVFLPANMVSSIFSTTFFNGSDGALSVSSDFWIYWVVLVVVTLVTMLLWFYLPRLSPEVKASHDDSVEEKGVKRLLQNHILSIHRRHTGNDFFPH
ncbi:hypothetical protein F5B19DRAFT_88679 [Rostrohypoxylon terebratum]|nr:hypothetical protein F5B19DRAFT_88679 [Rostrohypoxylon terebratum]